MPDDRDIFISYARDDRERVRPLAAALEQRGWSVWWDVELHPGEQFRETIEPALKAAKAVVVVWTERSIGRRWVLDEAEEGLARKVLVPLRIGAVVPPLGYRQIDTADITSWKGDPAHPELARAMRRIAALVGPDAGRVGAEDAPPKVVPAPVAGLQRHVQPLRIALWALLACLALLDTAYWFGLYSAGFTMPLAGFDKAFLLPFGIPPFGLSGWHAWLGYVLFPLALALIAMATSPWAHRTLGWRLAATAFVVFVGAAFAISSVDRFPRGIWGPVVEFGSSRDFISVYILDGLWSLLTIAAALVQLALAGILLARAELARRRGAEPARSSTKSS